MDNLRENFRNWLTKQGLSEKQKQVDQVQFMTT